MFSAGHEPTRASAFGAGYEPTQGSARLRIPSSPIPRGSTFGAGHEPPQTDPWDQRGGSAQPAHPWEVDAAISNGVGVCQPHEVKACQPTAVVLRSRLWRAGQEIGVAVGAAFAVLECTIERDDELKLPLNSCIVGPHFANALPCLVAGGYMELCSPKDPRRRLEGHTMLPVSKSRGVRCLSLD